MCNVSNLAPHEIKDFLLYFSLKCAYLLFTKSKRRLYFYQLCCLVIVDSRVVPDIIRLDIAKNQISGIQTFEMLDIRIFFFNTGLSIPNEGIQIFEMPDIRISGFFQTGLSGSGLKICIRYNPSTQEYVESADNTSKIWNLL